MKYDFNLDKNYILTHARAASLHPEFELVGAVDTDSRNRELFVSAFFRPAYKVISDALDATKPDIIIIATPSGTHTDILQEILDLTTPRAILCEKPLDQDLRKAELMLEKCSEKNIALYVNYMRRSDPGSLNVMQRLNSQKIKLPLKGVVWYSKGILNNGSHFLNLLELWLGPCRDIKFVSAGRSYSNSDRDYDFIAYFDRGEVYFNASLEATSTYNSIELISPSGRLAYEQGGSRITWQGIERNKMLLRDEVSQQPTIIQQDMDQYQYNVFEQLANALRGNDYALSTGSDAFITLKNINKVINGVGNG
jgi:predicted dehydrogenase